MAITKIEQYHGSPAIIIDGKPCPPMGITVIQRPGAERPPAELQEYFRRMGKAGLRLFYVCANTRWHTPGDAAAGIPDGVEAALRDIRFVLDVVPDAYVMLRLNVSPPASWVNAHPEEQVAWSDGSRRPVVCTSVVRGTPIDGMHSLCSEAWRTEGDKALADFFGALAAHPEFGRVVGAFICAGGTSEWYYPLDLDNPSGAVGDFSEPFRREYEAFLRRKYKTVEALRRAWKRPDATFEHPPVPTHEEREYIFRADDRIAEALRDWSYNGRTLGGHSLDVDARAETHVGLFLDANGHAHVADFFDAWHEATAETIIHFAQTIKRLRPDLLVGAFYGYFGCASFFNGSNVSAVLPILDSGAIDFLAGPGVYNNREPGGIVAQREMQDSFRLRNRLYICEDDSRTYRSKPWMQRDAMALYTVEDSIETLKRDFARNICEDIHGWWFDMGGDWYDDPAILALFRRQRAIADFAYSRDRTKHNDIALIYDAQSVHLVSQRTSELVCDYWRTSDLGRIGAPVDYYFHDDLARPDMPDYRLYIMVNLYCLTDAERMAIHEKARRNGAVILWLYAPGFIDPGAARTMDVANVEKTVGMKLGFIDRTFFPHFRVNPSDHPAVARASATRRYGVIDRDIHSNVWIGSVLRPPYLNPGFYIDDPHATILGRFCSDGLPALALADRDGVRSIYCAAPVMRSDLLASIAAYAGCHIFIESDDVLYANENFVAIHAGGDGRRTIRFKRPCSPFEVYEKRFYGHDVESIDVEMRLGQTLMWSLSGEMQSAG